MMRGRVAATLLLVCAGLLLPAGGADAHALLQTSDPPDGAQLDAAPAGVTLTFTEDPERSLSAVRVLDSAGASFETGRLERVAGRARTIRIRVKELGRGVYTVAWRVVSRVDGHATGGAFTFGVGVSPVDAPPTTATVETTPSVSPEEIGGRVLIYLGFLGLLGAAWMSAFAFRDPPKRATDLMKLAWVSALIGVVFLASAQRRAAGVGLGDLASTPIGRALIWRLAAVAAAGTALVVGIRTAGARKRWVLAAAGIAAAGGVYAHVAAGHAAASDPTWRNIASQWVHVTSAGIWVGGLAALLLGIRGASAEDKAHAVRRFSLAAGFALAVVAATGTVRAIDEVGSWIALYETNYGRLVIAKGGLIVALAALGAVNRYRNVPRSGSDLSALRRVSRAELVLATLALGAAAGLASVAPSAVAAPAPAQTGARPLVVTGRDFAETTRVRLEVSPGFAGSNVFRVRVVDADTGQSVRAARVALRFRFAGGESIGESQLELESSTPGTYTGRGGNLSLDGNWEITVIIQQAADSLEISLRLSTRCRADAVPVSAGPTLYTMLVATGKAQGYVDPGIAGANEVHVTFFDAAGGELPIAQSPSILATDGAGNARPFEVRRFGPGHFVADATLGRGRWRFAFAGAGPAGEALRGCFEETIR